MKRILIIEKLDWISFCVAIFYKLLRYALYTFLPIPENSNKLTIFCFKILQIELLDYKNHTDSKIWSVYSNNSVFEKLVCDHFLSKKDFEDLSKIYGFSKEDWNKIRIVYLDYFNKKLGGNFFHLMWWARHFHDNGCFVRVYSPNCLFGQIAIESVKLQKTELLFCRLSYLLYIFRFLKRKIVVPVRMGFANLVKCVITNISGNRFFKEHNSIAKFQVVYFPHQTPYYGILFKKDQFYSKDVESPFYEKNILHIEHSDFTNAEGEYKRTYSNNGIPFCRYKRIKPIKSTDRKRIEFSNICLLIRISLRKEIEHACVSRLLKFLIIADNYIDFSIHVNKIMALKSTKIALIGYDYLFPRIISLALKSVGVITVAVQERFVQAFYPAARYIFDVYFVSGKIVEDRLKLNDMMAIEKFHCVGLPRVDLLYQYRENNSRYNSLKKRYCILLALDFFSSQNDLDHSSSRLFNWDTNKSFYKDLIKLAVEFPDLYIIVRGKNNDWTNIPSFKDISDIMEFLPNIEISDRFELNEAYKIAAISDIVVAKHTSLADECLAAGKSVLLHEYSGSSIKRVVSQLIDYKNNPVFTYSYDELRNKIKSIRKHGSLFSESQMELLRKSYYSNCFNGKVKMKIQMIMEEKYKECFFKSGKDREKIPNG